MEEFRTGVVGDISDLIDEALANFPFPEGFTEEQIQQLRDAIVIPEGATMEQIQAALDSLVDRLPEAPTLDEMRDLFNEELSRLDIASPDDIREILANYGFTQEQLDQIAGAINIPPSATVADIERIIAGIPPGLSVEEITSALGSEFDALAEGISGVQAGVDDLAEQLGLTSDELINAINALSTKSSEELTETERNILAGLTGLADSFNTDLSSVVGSISGLSEDVVSGITTLGGQIETGFANVQEGIDGLADQLGITTEQLIGVLEGLEGRTTDQLSDLETSVIAGLAGLGTSFGVGINGVLESITGLSTDVVSGISDLSGQLTGVQSGINDLADQLGLTTDELIDAISNLSVKTSDQLTDIDRSIIDGLSGLATSFNTDITGVVSSITGLGVDVASGISGISSQISGLETAVTTGIEDLADQLNVSTDDIVNAVISIGSGLGGELTDLETSVLAGLGSLADILGTDIESVVGSIGGLGSDVVEGFEGISGELQTGFGQLGQQLGLLTAGLFGLSAKQPTAQQIAAAQPFEFKPFDERATPRQVQQVVQSQRVKQQPSALQQVNNLINRQTTTPQIQPINQGMFTGDPNRKLA
jgi:prophage DNA circulation protein